jgi:hypothetical protein
MGAFRSTALTQGLTDLVRTVSESGAAQNSRSQWMCGAVFI